MARHLWTGPRHVRADRVGLFLGLFFARFLLVLP